MKPTSVSIIDIGSNATRFVIYDNGKLPFIKLYKERVSCEFAKALPYTGLLDTQLLKRLIKRLYRFKKLCQLWQLTYPPFLIASEAVRAAKNKTYLSDAILRIFECPLNVLSGEEEAMYSAHSVLQSFDLAQGLIADFGGGSLELAYIDQQQIQQCISLPMGAHALSPTFKHGQGIISVQHFLDQIPNFTILPRQCYALGGSWCKLGKLYIEQQQSQVSHHGYEVSGPHWLLFLKQFLAQSSASDSLSYISAYVFKALLEKYAFEKIIFSALGLREGYIGQHLITTQSTKLSSNLVDAMCLWLEPVLSFLKLEIAYVMPYLQNLQQQLSLGEYTEQSQFAVQEEVNEKIDYIWQQVIDFFRYGYMPHQELETFWIKHLTYKKFQQAKKLGHFIKLALAICMGYHINQVCRLTIDQQKIALIWYYDYKDLQTANVFFKAKEIATLISHKLEIKYI